MAEGGSQFGSGGTPKPQLFLPGTGQGSHGDGTGTGANGDNHTENKGNAADGKTPADNARAEVYNSGSKPTTEVTNNGQGNRPTGPAEKIAPPAGGALASGQGNLNAEGSNLKSQEAKPGVPGASDNKTLSGPQQQAAPTDKTSPAVGKSQAEQVHAPGQNKELIATNPYNAPQKGDTSIQPQTAKSEANQNPQSHHYEGKDQAGTSALPLVRSDRNTTDGQQAKTNTAPAEKTPIGGDAREHKDSQAPPIAKVQENVSQNQNQNQKLTNYETKPEPKSSSIPPAVPIPSDIHSAQKNQNPVSTAHQPEAPPVAPQKDLASKPADPNVRSADVPKQTASDGKVASEALKDTKYEGTRSPELAGAGGEKNSAGDGRTAHESPITKESVSTNGGTAKQFDVAHEATTTEARGDKIQPHSQIGHSEQMAVNPSRVDGIDAIIEKDRNNQIENTILLPGRKTDGEPSVRIQNGKQNSSKDEDGSEVGKKQESRSLGLEGIAGGSIGANLDARGLRNQDTQKQNNGDTQTGRGNHESENPFVAFKAMLSDASAAKKGPVDLPGRQIEIFKTNEGEIHLAFDDKRTFKLLSELLQQFRTKDIRSTDPDSLAILRMFAEMKSGNQAQLAEVLAGKPIDGETVKLLINEKDTPDRALERKEWMNKLAENVARLAPLKALVKAAVDPFMQLQAVITKLLLPKVDDHADAGRLVAVYAEEPEPIAKQAQELLSTTYDAALLLKAAVDEIEEGADSDNTDSVAAVPTNKAPQVTARPKYKVAENDTYESIAVKQLGNPLLGDLIKRINGHFDTVDLHGEYDGHKLVAGAEIELPTPKECKQILQPAQEGKIP